MVRNLFLLLFFFSFISKGSDSIIRKDSSSICASVFTSFDYNSNCVNSSFANSLYRGEGLERSEIERIINKAGDRNKLLLQYKYGAQFKFQNKAGIKWQVGFAERTFLDSKFTDDAFALLFSGNSRFAGQTVDIAGSGFRFLRYQQFFAGASFSRNRNHWSVSLALLNGKQYEDLTIDRGSLYTDTFGIALDLDAAAEFRKNGGGSGRLKNRGNGFSVDICYKRPVSTLSSDLFISVQDLGLIEWNESSRTERIDTSIYYEGFELSTLFDFSDSVSADVSADSLRNDFVTRDKGSFITPLPALISAGLEQRAGDLFFRETIQYRIYSYAWPEAILEAGKQFGKCNASLIFRAGGYSYFGTGVSFTCSNPVADVSFRAENIQGFFLPGQYGGASFQVKLSKCF